MKIRKNRKLGGILMMAAGVAFFVAAMFARQPAFSGAGTALFVIGIAIANKASKS
jgi:membrane-bound ClpP family serine protease